MRILAPLKNIDYYEKLATAGADEFYIGLIPFEWISKYGMKYPLNRREFFLGCNLGELTSLKYLKEKQDKNYRRVSITLNSHNYPFNTYEDILKFVDSITEIGFKDFIISDLNLIQYLCNNRDLNIHLSGEAMLVNHHFLEAIYDKKLTRIVFPRKLPIKDMKSIINNTSKRIEFEAFILNSLCPFSGGLCQTDHVDGKNPMCFNELILNDKNNILVDESTSMLLNNQTVLGDEGCGMCKLFDLKDAGVQILKIVGREFGKEKIVKDLKVLKSLVNLLDHFNTSNNFESYVKEKLFNNHCPFSKGSCYYPEISNA